MVCVNEVAGEHVLGLRVQKPCLALQIPAQDSHTLGNQTCTSSCPTDCMAKACMTWHAGVQSAYLQIHMHHALLCFTGKQQKYVHKQMCSAMLMTGYCKSDFPVLAPCCLHHHL